MKPNTQPEVETFARKMVEKDVILCVTKLILAIYNAPVLIEGATDISSCHLHHRVDYDTPATDYLEDANRDSLIDYLDNRSVNLTGKESLEQLHSIAESELQEQGAAEFCADMAVSPYYDEAAEFWVVTKELGKALQEKGEAVAFDFLGMNIWGRTTSGQSIYMDSVIEQIAKDRG